MKSKTSPKTLRTTIARSIGMSASIYGYPLVEMLRRCRLQTASNYSLRREDKPSINELTHSGSPPILGWVSECGNLATLYTSGWLWLGNGPLELSAPPRAAYPACSLQLFFHDARFSPVGSFAPGARDEAVGTVLLAGPRDVSPSGSCGRVLASQTDLVWVAGHALFEPSREADAYALLGQIRIGGDACKARLRRPSVIEMWQGECVDPMVELTLRRSEAEKLAPAFYGNLCRAMMQLTGSDRSYISKFRFAGLMPDALFDWSKLDKQVQAGLIAGLEDAARAIARRSHALREEGALNACAARHLARARAVYAAQVPSLYRQDISSNEGAFALEFGSAV